MKKLLLLAGVLGFYILTVGSTLLLSHSASPKTALLPAGLGIGVGLTLFKNAALWAHRFNRFAGLPHPKDCLCGGGD